MSRDDSDVGDVPSDDPHAIRIVAVGDDLRVPEHAWRAIPTAALECERDELEQLASRHGAVLFQTWWHDGWRPALVLRVDAPWLVLEHDGRRIGIEATAAERGHFLALVTDEVQCSWAAVWDRAPEIASPDLVVWHDGAWESAHGRLRRHPLIPTATVRDWNWAGSGGYPGDSLAVWVDRSREDIQAFVDACAPLPYERHAPGSYRVQDGEHLRHTFDVNEHGLQWWRSYATPSDAVREVDAGILLALVDGALGELRWDLVELDYGTYLATGEDRASLAAYLSTESDRDEQRDRWRALFAEQRCDAATATTLAELRDRVAHFLGAPDIDSDAGFDSWLAAQPITALPRCFRVEVGPQAPPNALEWLTRISRTQPRLRWAVTYAR